MKHAEHSWAIARVLRTFTSSIKDSTRHQQRRHALRNICRVLSVYTTRSIRIKRITDSVSSIYSLLLLPLYSWMPGPQRTTSLLLLPFALLSLAAVAFIKSQSLHSEICSFSLYAFLDVSDFFMLSSSGSSRSRKKINRNFDYWKYALALLW